MLCDIEYFSESNCWLGGPQTGKTHAIVSHACSLVRLGEKAEACRKPEVLVLCATPAGQAEAQTAIERILDSSKQSLRVGLVRTVALEIMAEPEACALFGRKPRILDAFEERFLLEDMRTTRFKGRRIRDVMEFLRGGWSRLADDDEGWLITLEEEAIAHTLRANLQFTGGIMASELGNLAVNTLRTHAEVRERHAATHVLVDDYSLLDRASQVFVRMLADTSFSFSGDVCPTPLTFDDFPYPEGIDEFLKAHPRTAIHSLNNSFQAASLAQTVSRLQTQSEQLSRTPTHGRKSFGARYAEMMKQKRPDKTSAQDKDEAAKAASDTCNEQSCRRASSSSTQTTEKCEGLQLSRQQVDTTPSLSVHTEATLNEELRAIVQLCQQAIDSGEDILVVGAHTLWRKRLRRELRDAHIPVVSEEPIRIRDFRDEQGCARARSKTIARLEGDPHDGVAWRSLVGFGDYMAQSAGLEKVRKAAQGHGLGIEKALARLAEGALEGVDAKDPLCKPLADAYRQAREMLADSSAQEASDKPHASEKRAHDIHDGVLNDQAFGHGTGRVMLCSPRDAVGIQAPTLIFGGFVSGILPSRANLDAGGTLKEVPPRKQADDLLLIRAVIGRATRRVIITSFVHCGLEEAERMGLGISRIKLHCGTRVCVIQPSTYLDTLLEQDARS